jgi:hypothetical protein
MKRPWPSLFALAITGASLLAPMPARAEILVADCYVAYRITDYTLTELWVPFQVSSRTLAVSVDPTTPPAVMKRACLQHFYDNARLDCTSGPGMDLGLIQAQVDLNTLDSDGFARSKSLLNDARSSRTATKITWRKCSALPSP